MKEKIEKTKSGRKTKFYLLVLLVGVGLTVWSVFFKGDGSLKLTEDGTIEDEEEVTEENEIGTVSGMTGSYLQGRLENSDDSIQGNYKLISDFGQIYIKTGRNFSALIGSNVLLSIDGTMESFTLLDIQKRVEKDGYIQSQ